MHVIKPSALIVGLLLSMSSPALASTKCFLIRESGNVLTQEGICSERTSPCSTFKIPLSLMAYHEKILTDETSPEWPYHPDYEALLPASLDLWKAPHTPTTWMKHSCVWYSQLITQKMGMKKFAEYVQAFDYGNQDVSGDKGKNNGLTHAWLMSSLKISPAEQIDFLEKLIHSQLPVSQEAQAVTRAILYVEDLPKGWKLYGKTGSGSLLNTNH